MATPDVRVRLSAEGVAEVVAALRQISDEANRAGKGSGFGLLNDALRELKGLLPAIGIAAAVTGMVSLGKAALDNAESIGKLAQKTGDTVEHLSVLSVAAQSANVDQESLATGLEHLAKTLDQAGAGAKEPTDALKRLGLTLADIQGLNAGEQFVLIADKLGGVKDGADKAALAQQLFGRSGAELIPLLNSLAGGGFEEVRQKALALGLVLSKDLTDAAQQAKDALTETGQVASGLATQFLAGFAPQMTAALQAINDAFEQHSTGGSGLQKFGTAVGYIVRGVVALFDFMGKTVGATLATMEVKVTTLIDQLQALGHLDFKGVAAAESDARAKLQGIAEAYKEDITGIWDRLVKAPETVAPKAGGTGTAGAPDNEKLKAVIAARAALLKSQADNELALTKTRLMLEDAADKRAYDEGLLSLTDYFSQRRERLEEETNAEAAALRAKIAITEKTAPKDDADAAKKQEEIGKLRTSLAQLELQKQGELAALDYEKSQAEVKSLEDRLSLESDLASKQGDRYTAAIAGLEEEILKTDELMKRQGISAENRAAVTSDLRVRGTAAAGFGQASLTGETELADIARQRDEIQIAIDSGQTSRIEGEQKIIDLYKQELPALQAVANQMTALAEASGDIGLIKQAKDFQLSIDQLKGSVNTTIQLGVQLKQTVFDAGLSSLSNFFSTGIAQAKSFGDAFRSMAASFAQSIANMISQIIAFKLISSAFGAFGISVPVSASGFAGHASGGVIRGPGSGTSDSVPIWGSAGEFVTRARVVAQPGALAFLDSFNREGMPVLRRYAGARGFAEGGLIGDPAKASSGGSNALTVGLEDGLVLRHLQTPEGERAVVRIVGRNQKALRRALGVGG